MNKPPLGRLIGASLGPGDPELITVKGRRLISEADLVLYAGSLVPAAVVACAKAEASWNRSRRCLRRSRWRAGPALLPTSARIPPTPPTTAFRLMSSPKTAATCAPAPLPR